MARRASLIEKIKESHPVILLDAGDFSEFHKSEWMELEETYYRQVMDEMNYTAAAIGEKDLMLGRDRLLSFAREAALPLVSANLYDRRTRELLAQPHLIAEAGGNWTITGKRGEIRVGIFSVVLPVFVYQLDPEASEYYRVVNPKISALESVTSLRKEGCDLIVGLSHLGWSKSRKLAGEVPGIDILINSPRSHSRTHSTMIDSTLVVDTGVKRVSFTEIVVEFGEEGPEIKAFDRGSETIKYRRHPRLVELEEELEKKKKELARKKNTRPQAGPGN